VDNTFLSPALQQPIALGAHFATHSTTKYLNGHSDVVGGAVIAAEKADFGRSLCLDQYHRGTGPPFDAYLALRGLRTLFPRIERQQATAATVAKSLQEDPRVSAVHYPGLKSHPGHAIAKAEQAGVGAVLSFELVGGVTAARRCGSGRHHHPRRTARWYRNLERQKSANSGDFVTSSIRKGFSVHAKD